MPLGAPLHKASARGWRKAARSGLLGCFAIASVLLVARATLGHENASLLVASMGASAVLLFSVPEGQLSQPWPLFGGHLFSALIGVVWGKLVDDPILGSALAVGCAIGVMELFGCVHPPGGATALAAIVGGPAVRALGFYYVLTPVLLNVSILFVTALLLHAPRRRYPHRPEDRPVPERPSAGDALPSPRSSP